MNLVLFDNVHKKALLPLTYTRPMGALRCGILTIAEKWAHSLKGELSYLCNALFTETYPFQLNDSNIYIAGNCLPSSALVIEVLALLEGQGLYNNDRLIAFKADRSAADMLQSGEEPKLEKIFSGNEVVFIDKPYHLLVHNKAQIESDFILLCKGRSSQAISETVTVVGAHKQIDLVDRIFIEEGAEVECCYLNPKDGPIYIGKKSTVMEGAMLRGPIALCESAQISMGAKIYGGTTVGPHSKVGGEVANSIVIGYSNKVHDGYLGDSVIGEWCNLGADTNTSNLKNDYAQVKLWDYASERFQRTGLQFCGLIMGDYSRCAINTSFNTGTIVGVGSNIFGSGFPRNFVPSFVIGGSQGYKINGLKAVKNVAAIAMKRRGIECTSNDEKVLDDIFEQSEKYRISFK